MELVLYPDPLLYEVAQPINKIDDQIHELAAQMIEKMHESSGVGLAGPQVGVSKQIIVVNPTAEWGDEEVYINPKILKKKGGDSETEGCLSLPEITGTVTRSTWIKVSATLLSGEEVTFETEDFHARVLQHEIDHLLGILFISKIEPAEKIAIRGLLKNMERQYKEK